MRILLVSPFPRDVARGNSVAADRLAQGFGERGHTVAVVDGVGRWANAPGCQEEALREAGPADVALILHAAHGAAAARWLAERGTPFAISLRGTDANEMLDDPVRGAAVRATLARAARVVVFHEAMRTQLCTRVPEVAGQVRVVFNGLRLPASHVDYRQRLGLPPDALVFVSLAGLRAVKRPLFPAEQLARLVRGFPRLRLVRAGPEIEDETAAAMRAFAAAHDWVLDAGEIPHATVDSFLRMGDIFVSASRSEGMPHAVREAMLTGRALLLSDIPGHRAMAEPEHEALFFDGEASFQATARRLITDAGLRRTLGDAARKRTETELAKHDEIGEYLDLLVECAVEKRTERSLFRHCEQRRNMDNIRRTHD